MKRIVWARLCVFVLALSFVRAAPGEAATRKPTNFVIILVDDLGWTDLSCQGSKYFETPHVDKLAAEGMRFTDGYAACAVCSPTRAAVQTGRYPARVGVTDWIRARFQGGIIPPSGKNPSGYTGRGKLLCPLNALFMESDEITLAEALEPAGYVSCHIGKWHLGQQAHFPEKQGYDFNHGGCDLGQPPNYFDPYRSGRPHYLIPNLKPRKEGEYLTDREADEAVAFIEANKGRPFLLNMCHYAVHTPIQAKKDVTAKYAAKPKTNQKNPVYAAMVESVDDATGKIVAALDECGVADRTLVIFTSDNGPWLSKGKAGGCALPLRAGKFTVYEGGMRMPCIMRWPGRIPAGTTCSEVAATIDVLPTLARLAGAEAPTDRTIDGRDIAPLMFAAPGAKSPHEAYFLRTGAVRAGKWKLHLKGHRKKGKPAAGVELYDLEADISEKHNVAAEHPEVVERLTRLLMDHRQDLATNHRPVGKLEEVQ